MKHLWFWTPCRYVHGLLKALHNLKICYWFSREKKTLYILHPISGAICRYLCYCFIVNLSFLWWRGPCLCSSLKCDIGKCEKVTMKTLKKWHGILSILKKWHATLNKIHSPMIVMILIQYYSLTVYKLARLLQWRKNTNFNKR